MRNARSGLGSVTEASSGAYQDSQQWDVSFGWGFVAQWQEMGEVPRVWDAGTRGADMGGRGMRIIEVEKKGWLRMEGGGSQDKILTRRLKGRGSTIDI